MKPKKKTNSSVPPKQTLQEVMKITLYEGNPDTERKEAELEPAPVLWNPVPGTKGLTPPELPGDDEDSEGRSTSERLVEKGILKAAKEQMQQAGRFDDKQEP